MSTWIEQDLFGRPAPCTVTPAMPESAGQIIPLPEKPTCSPREAARCLGVSARQIRYWVEEGILLAIDSSRMPVSGRKAHGKLNRWRVVVNRADGSATPTENEFLTLAEFLPRITNKEIN